MPKNPYNPYSQSNTTGPGPSGRKTKKRGRWERECITKGTVQTCECEGLLTPTGRKSRAHKTVKNDLKAKKKYRVRYKKWAKKRGRR